jgi:hypothetical protein
MLRAAMRAWTGMMCLGAVLIIGAGGCGGSKSAGAAATAKASAAGYSGSVLRPQAALLALPAGHSSAHFRITAPSPARYDFDVALNFPAAAHVVVQFRTWYGAVLDILDYKPGEQSESSTVNSQATGCKSVGSRLLCVQHYPLLPAQKGGAWTVLVSKRSLPSATVRVAVTFHKP